ncbi:MAG: ISAs1 family transposase [Corynebacterium provencense]|jgi:hypothetical protein|uniref:ISAs1 family transposase n=1 Tax=Corynebacterium provencense TaxID=1737425 RepID=UPI002989A5D5|nr:ISAs1 family transposase [Corynebacterium provencense]
MPSSLSATTSVEPTSKLTAPPLLDLLSDIPDHRDPRGVRHRLSTLLAAALAAVIAGRQTYISIARWITHHLNTDIADLGIDLCRRPSEATVRRALSSVNADRLDRVLGAWMFLRTGHIAGRRVIAINGKTVRGARDHPDPTSTAPHLLAALCHTTGTVLGQCQIDSKSNEIPALRDLLDVFDLNGALVTADALHCQHDRVLFELEAAYRHLEYAIGALPAVEVAASEHPPF